MAALSVFSVVGSPNSSEYLLISVLIATDMYFLFPAVPGETYLEQCSAGSGGDGVKRDRMATCFIGQSAATSFYELTRGCKHLEVLIFKLQWIPNL